MPVSKKTRHIMVSYSRARDIRDAMASALGEAFESIDCSALAPLDGYDYTLRDGNLTWTFADNPTPEDQKIRDRGFAPNRDGPHMALLNEHVAPVVANLDLDAVAEKLDFDYQLSWKHTVISISIDRDDVQDPDKVYVTPYVWLTDALDFVEHLTTNPLRASALHHYPTVIEAPPEPVSPVTSSPTEPVSAPSSPSRKRPRSCSDSSSDDDDDDEFLI